MKKRALPTARFLALWLILGIALPSPAGAGHELGRRTLRPGSGVDDPQGPVRTGLEEVLRPSTPAAGVEEAKGRLTKAVDGFASRAREQFSRFHGEALEPLERGELRNWEGTGRIFSLKVAAYRLPDVLYDLINRGKLKEGGVKLRAPIEEIQRLQKEVAEIIKGKGPTEHKEADLMVPAGEMEAYQAWLDNLEREMDLLLRQLEQEAAAGAEEEWVNSGTAKTQVFTLLNQAASQGVQSVKLAIEKQPYVVDRPGIHFTFKNKGSTGSIAKTYSTDPGGIAELLEELSRAEAEVAGPELHLNISTAEETLAGRMQRIVEARVVYDETTHDLQIALRRRPPAAGAEEEVLASKEAIKKLEGLVGLDAIKQISSGGITRMGRELKKPGAIETLVNAASSNGEVKLRYWGAPGNKVDLTPPTAGAEESVPSLLQGLAEAAKAQDWTRMQERVQKVLKEAPMPVPMAIFLLALAPGPQQWQDSEALSHLAQALIEGWDFEKHFEPKLKEMFKGLPGGGLPAPIPPVRAAPSFQEFAPALRLARIDLGEIPPELREAALAGDLANVGNVGAVGAQRLGLVAGLVWPKTLLPSEVEVKRVRIGPEGIAEIPPSPEAIVAETLAGLGNDLAKWVQENHPEHKFWRQDLFPSFPAAGAEEGPVRVLNVGGAGEIQVRITTPTDEGFWDAFYHRLDESQRAEVMSHLQRARARGEGVEITAVTGVTDFYLHTDPGLAAVADRMAGEYPVEGIRFEVSQGLRSRPKTPDAFEAPGLMVPDAMVEPAFLWPEGSRPPVRLTEPVGITDMAGIRPAGWIALSYNPTLTIQHILSQDVLLITLRDDHGTAVLAFA